MAKFLFVTDLDNTLVGDDKAMVELNRQLSQHRQEHGTKIVYATGRSLTLYRQLAIEKQLLEPDALIAAVGTEIYYDIGAQPDSGWSEQLSHGWDRDTIVASAAHFADLVAQPDSEQRPFKVSYYLTESAAVEVLPQLEQLLQERGLDIKIVYSSGVDLDILPRCSDKGLAVQFLRKSWGIEPQRTVSCGDSGNDIALFRASDQMGIIVGNAQPELLKWYETNSSQNLYFAKAYCAGGILEGLKHFGFLS